MRQEGRNYFLNRLKLGVLDGSLPAKTDVKSLATALNTLLEGMSIQARDGLSRAELEKVGLMAVAMLPLGSRQGG